MITQHTLDVSGRLVIDYEAREWCKLPYLPDHRAGCPNYGKKPTCPPHAPLIEEFLDLTQPHHFLIVRFDLQSHVAKMRERHPGWSRDQLRCLLYWQGTVMKALRAMVAEHLSPGQVNTYIPEAMGVNVLLTLENHSFPVERRPETYVAKVALIGNPGESRRIETKAGG